MSDPLKKMLDEEQKKLNAKLRYRHLPQPNIKLPSFLPNLIPFAPKNETPAWTKEITAEDSAELNSAINLQKEKQSKLNEVLGQPTQRRGTKRRLK